MNENLYKIVDEILLSDFEIKTESNRTVIELGENAEYGKMETYSIFPGVIISYVDLKKIDNIGDVFLEGHLSHRMLEINHCFDGRYAYQVGNDKIVYFQKGDLCISISGMTKSISDFPLGFYKGLEIFMDVDVANEYVKHYIPDFDLIEFYDELNRDKGYVLIRSNEKIDHVIGELYDVDERIMESYFKLKYIELLLFFSITEFKEDNRFSLSKKQLGIVENVKEDLIHQLDNQITIDELASKYGISKTTLKNCFKEVYGKPIFKWRKEYKLDYACKLLKSDDLSISEISKRVGYSSPSKFSHAFKDYVGCNPSDYKK